MYIAQMTVTDFRNLGDAELEFQPGLNVIVGENNCGKTAVIDAIRTILGDRALEADDFRRDVKADHTASAISIDLTFEGLGPLDEAAFLEALVPSVKTSGKYQARLALTGALKDDDVQRIFSLGKGNRSGNYQDLLRSRKITYLRALRDPESATGLKPGRQSQLAALLHRVSSQEERDYLRQIAKNASKDLKASEAVGRARTIVHSNLQALSGLTYAQTPDLSFIDPDFHRLASTLEGLADGLGIELNGLGYGNLYYVAAVIGDLKEAQPDKRYRALIIEEPEAHLHPQHQILLLRFLRKVALTIGFHIQVFVTAHSPILASQASVDRLLPVVRNGNSVRVRPIDPTATNAKAVRLQQYLDATRSELFFARRLVLVEGDAEQILLPAIARRFDTQGRDLADQGATIVGAAGLNFSVFLPFIGANELNVPVAIITDTDPPVNKTVNGEELQGSAYLKKLQSLVASDPMIEVFPASVTFEYDLALEVENFQALLVAMQRVRPRKTPQFAKSHGKETGAAFARAFYDDFFKNSDTSKAEFALELALVLDDTELSVPFKIPSYLREALDHVLKDVTPA